MTGYSSAPVIETLRPKYQDLNNDIDKQTTANFLF
jgi:hypothetical protein